MDLESSDWNFCPADEETFVTQKPLAKPTTFKEALMSSANKKVLFPPKPETVNSKSSPNHSTMTQQHHKSSLFKQPSSQRHVQFDKKPKFAPPQGSHISKCDGLGYQGIRLLQMYKRFNLSPIIENPVSCNGKVLSGENMMQSCVFEKYCLSVVLFNIFTMIREITKQSYEYMLLPKGLEILNRLSQQHLKDQEYPSIREKLSLMLLLSKSVKFDDEFDFCHPKSGWHHLAISHGIEVFLAPHTNKVISVVTRKLINGGKNLYQPQSIGSFREMDCLEFKTVPFAKLRGGMRVIQTYTSPGINQFVSLSIKTEMFNPFNSLIKEEVVQIAKAIYTACLICSVYDFATCDEDSSPDSESALHDICQRQLEVGNVIQTQQYLGIAYHSIVQQLQQIPPGEILPELAKHIEVFCKFN